MLTNNNVAVADDPPEYTVVYAPGVQGTWSAVSQTYTVVSGDPTPAFTGSYGSKDAGWLFVNWSPIVSPTVLHDVVYTASWYTIGINSTSGNPLLTFVVNDDLTILLHIWGTGSNRRLEMTIVENGFVSAHDVFSASSGTATVTFTLAGISLTIEFHGNDFGSDALDTALTDRFAVFYDAGEHGLFSDGTNMVYHLGIMSGQSRPAAPVVVAYDGWTHTGWSPALASTVTDHVTYTAQYSPTNYTVSYNANGGVGAPSGSNVYHAGDTVTVLPDTPSLTGYTFDGWLYNGVVYHAGGTITMPAANVTFTAQWTQDMYTVVYAPGAQGSWTADSETTGNLIYGAATPGFGGNTATDHVPGYSFNGWSPVVNGTVSCSVTYVAQWVANEYWVAYEPGTQGTFAREFYDAVGGGPIRYGNSTPGFVGPASGNAGYSFAGWNGTWSSTVTKNVTYVAQWVANEYWVDYVPGDQGTFTHELTSGLSYNAVTPGFVGPASGNAGYSFAGWNGTWSSTVTKNVTYVAQWVVDYFVSYNANGGVGAPSDSNVYHVNDPVTVSSTVPTRTGYIFDGWLYNSVTYVDGDSFGMPAGNVELVAVWSVDPYNVVYTVHYYVQGTVISVATDKVVDSNLLGDNVTETAVTVPGYTVVAPSTKSLILGTGVNMINFYYVVNVPPVISYSLSYHSVSLTSGSVPASRDYIAGASVPVADAGDMVLDGSVFLGWDTSPSASTVVYNAGVSITISNANVDLYAVWQEDEVVPLTTSYTVHYYLENTAVQIASDKVRVDSVGSVISESAITVSGYTAITPTSISKTLSDDPLDNIFIFYYTANAVPTVSYTVHYYIQGTTTTVINSKSVSGQTVGTSVTEYAATVSGYTAVAPTSQSKTLSATASNNIFIFYYTANPAPTVSYTVYYYVQGTTNNVTNSKIVSGQTAGASISESAVSVSGYTAVAPTSVTVTLNATGNNEIKFYYTTNPAGGNNNNSPSPTPSPSAKASPSPSPSSSPAPTNSPSPHPSEITRNEPETEPVWSLVSLILSIVGLLLAVAIFFVFTFMPQQKQDNNSQNNRATKKKHMQTRTLLLVTSLVMGIVGIAVFLLTEDMSRTMGWVDNWSIVNVIIFVIEIIAISLTFKFKNNN